MSYCQDCASLLRERDQLRLALQEAQDMASTYALRVTEASNERIKALNALQESQQRVKELNPRALEIAKNEFGFESKNAIKRLESAVQVYLNALEGKDAAEINLSATHTYSLTALQKENAQLRHEIEKVQTLNGDLQIHGLQDDALITELNRQLAQQQAALQESQQKIMKMEREILDSFPAESEVVLGNFPEQTVKFAAKYLKESQQKVKCIEADMQAALESRQLYQQRVRELEHANNSWIHENEKWKEQLDQQQTIIQEIDKAQSVVIQELAEALRGWRGRLIRTMSALKNGGGIGHEVVRIGEVIDEMSASPWLRKEGE